MEQTEIQTRMFGVNFRMPDDLIDELNLAADSEHRTIRGLIRHALRLYLSSRGFLDYYDVKTPLTLASELQS